MGGGGGGGWRREREGGTGNRCVSIIVTDRPMCRQLFEIFLENLYPS